MRLKRDLKRHTSRTKAYQQPSIPQCFIAALDISDFCLYCEACSFSQLKYSKRNVMFDGASVMLPLSGSDAECQTTVPNVSIPRSLTEFDATAQVSTGTTIMAVEFDGGVVLGADTRTSAGQYVVNRASRKISQIHQRIFVARSGSAADTQQLTSYVKLFLSKHAIELGDLPRVNTAASVMQLLCYQNKDYLLAGLIVAGWDKRLGGQVYQIPLGGTRLRTPYAVGGSGSAYIAAYAESTFRSRMTKQECLDFVKKCIAYAISIDGSSGGLIRLTAVTQDAVEEHVVTGDQLPVPL